MTEQEIRRLIADHAPQIRAYHDRLSALVTRTQEAGIQAVLITQPMLAGDVIDPTTGVNLATAVDADYPDRNGIGWWRLLERYNDEARQIAAATGSVLIDLAALLPKDSRFFIDFVHYGNEGSEAVGKIVAEQLRQHLLSETGT
jgi:hypothetical protein